MKIYPHLSEGCCLSSTSSFALISEIEFSVWRVQVNYTSLWFNKFTFQEPLCLLVFYILDKIIDFDRISTIFSTMGAIFDFKPFQNDFRREVRRPRIKHSCCSSNFLFIFLTFSFCVISTKFIGFIFLCAKTTRYFKLAHKWREEPLRKK